MKRILVTIVVMVGAVLLTGCDGFGSSDKGINNLYYDEQNGVLNISYDIPAPKADDETGVTPVQTIWIRAKHIDGAEWIDVVELTEYKVEDMQIPFDVEQYGDWVIQITVLDDAGGSIFSTDEVGFYINEPQFIYNFDVHFDQWGGVVRFNIGVNDGKVNKYTINKSKDGGLTWEEVATVIKDDEFMKYEFEYYEYDEGNYVYQLVVFDGEEELQTMPTWGEISVYYDNQNFEGVPEVNMVQANYDVYSKNVNVWWDAFGDYDVTRIEKSLDMENWVIIGEVPRIGQAFNYFEETDGDYYYRVSAMVDGVSVSTVVSAMVLRVNSDAVIGHLDGWTDWESGDINLNWDFQSETVTKVVVIQVNEDGTEIVLGEFGNLKKSHTIAALEPGTYTFKIVVYNGEEIIDSLSTKEFYIEAPNYVYHLNGNYDTNTGVVQFYFGVAKDEVDYIVIEKSSDFGTTYEEIITMTLDNEKNEDYASYLEFDEGTFRYRMTGYNMENEAIGTVELGWDIMVSFDHLNLQQPTQIHWVDMSSDIYNSYVNIWWDSQGEYYAHLIEKSVDNETWEQVGFVPRVAYSFNYNEMTDGNYYYRVSAVDETGTVINTRQSEYTVRVKQNALIGHIDLYFDWDTSAVNVSWDLLSDKEVTIVLSRRTEEETEFTYVDMFDQNQRQFLDMINVSDTYVYLVQVYDEFDVLLDEIESYAINVEVPVHVYHLNVWFNQQKGEVEFNFGLNFNKVATYQIARSEDGGLTWEIIIINNVELNENNWYVENASYYEENEGTYVYNITGFDENGFEVGSVSSYQEINVNYDNLNFDNPVQAYNIDANYDIYNNTVYIWFNTQGTYATHLIEKSVDGITWETVTSLPRLVTFFDHEELVDGSYYYKVSLLADDGTVLDSVETNYTTRVKQDAQINYMNLYYNWDNQSVELNFDFIDDNVATVRIERRLESETAFETLGTFGSLKRIFTDDLAVSGDYVYKLVLLDADGNVLDELESHTVTVDLPVE